MNMSKPILISIVTVITAIWGWENPRSTQLSSATGQEANPPFLVSIVPTKSGEEPIGRQIAMAKTSPGSFYVILTNISKESQEAFESWNSWGYQAISFEVQTAGGLKITITKKGQDFTRNFPSTFLIPPGESMVYPISLDDRWNGVPSPPIADETPLSISLRAVYEVGRTPEAAKGKVWTGRVESKPYDLKLRHW